MPNYWPSPVTIGASTICSSIAASNTRTLSPRNYSKSSANEKQEDYPSGGRTEREVVDVLRHPPPVAFSFPEAKASQPTNGNPRIVFHFAKSRTAKFQTPVGTRREVPRLCSQTVLAPLLA